MMSAVKPICATCDDTGWRYVSMKRDDGKTSTRVTRCECRLVGRVSSLLEKANIPCQYQHCILSNYETDFPSATPVLTKALISARSVAHNFPFERRGIVFEGPCGTGKTHLAVGILKEIISKGTPGLFRVYGELLTEIRNTYSKDPETGYESTELALLDPVFNVDVLVLDDLGAQKTTEWNLGIVYEILNRRYNAKRLTIITTNLPIGSPSPKASAKLDNLGDRIGERAVSRLYEMCHVVSVQGADFRKIVSAHK